MGHQNQLIGMYNKSRWHYILTFLLMSLCMSWSVVSFASIHAMPDPPHEQSLSQMSMHCHHAHQLEKAVQHSADLAPCKQKKSALQHASIAVSQHDLQQCDCVQMHCQNTTLVTAWTAEPLQWNITPIIQQHPPMHSQHLHGYWQEILRPPKI